MADYDGFTLEALSTKEGLVLYLGTILKDGVKTQIVKTEADMVDMFSKRTRKH
jgi:hypothetical protein